LTASSIELRWHSVKVTANGVTAGNGATGEVPVALERIVRHCLEKRPPLAAGRVEGLVAY